MLLFLSFTTNSYSQDATMLYRDAAPLYINPAYAGNENFTRAAISYRNQYPSAGKGFVTYNASFDMFIPKFNSGLGLMYVRDQPGSKAYNYNSINLAYSYRLTFSENSFLRAGILGNLYFSSKDPSSLTFPDMVNPDGSIIPNPDPYERSNYSDFDFGTGIVFNKSSFTVGASLYHIGNQNSEPYHYRALKLYTHAEMHIPLYKKQSYAGHQSSFQQALNQAAIIPNIYYWQQDYTKIAGIGIDLQTKNFILGLSSRQDIEFESLLFSIHLGFTATFMEIGYIFDIGKIGDNINGLAATSHEIGIIFKFGDTRDY